MQRFSESECNAFNNHLLLKQGHGHFWQGYSGIRLRILDNRGKVIQINIMLKVKCKNCGKRFPSSLSYDRDSFKHATIVEQTEVCPNCGGVSIFNTEDYYFE